MGEPVSDSTHGHPNTTVSAYPCPVDEDGGVCGRDDCSRCGAKPVRIVPTDMPGLFDVQMSDGTWRNDLTHGQVRHLDDALDYGDIRALS